KARTAVWRLRMTTTRAARPDGRARDEQSEGAPGVRTPRARAQHDDSDSAPDAAARRASARPRPAMLYSLPATSAGTGSGHRLRNGLLARPLARRRIDPLAGREEAAARDVVQRARQRVGEVPAAGVEPAVVGPRGEHLGDEQVVAF